jgi:hypothetical protein
VKYKFNFFGKARCFLLRALLFSTFFRFLQLLINIFTLNYAVFTENKQNMYSLTADASKSLAKQTFIIE